MNKMDLYNKLLGFRKNIRVAKWLPFVLILGLVSACQKDEDVAQNSPESEYTINQWILDNMNAYYLWAQHIPKKTDQTLQPSEYFETLIYERQTIDRFSWIQDNFIELMQSLSGVNNEAGYDYSLLKWSDTSDAVVGCITYIKRGTAAEQAGLKRGDIFAAINGVQLTIGNYSSLMKQIDKPHTLGLIDQSKISATALAIERTISLSVAVYAENPILLDTIYTINGVKIGYIFYTFFANDNGNGDITYIKQLNEVFGRYINAGIRELIVDLRYNGGGALSTTEAFAAMISGKGTSDLFGVTEYNSTLSAMFNKEYGSNYNKVYFPNNINKYNDKDVITERVAINKLRNLGRVYFIVSRRSASASEMLINAIKPYMTTILVGEKTYGKNVGSITIYEEDAKKQEINKWGMQPIVVRYSNANGDSNFASGFTPDVSKSELAVLPLKPLGDVSETLLNTAISTIFGVTTLSAEPEKHINIIGSSLDRTPIRNNMYFDPYDSRSRTIRSAMK